MSCESLSEERVAEIAFQQAAKQSEGEAVVATLVVFVFLFLWTLYGVYEAVAKERSRR